MNAALRLLVVVWAKELRDALRDRRSLVSALVFPLFAPAMTFLLLSSATDIVREASDLSVPTIGAEQAPDLIAFLEQHHVEITAGPDDPYAAIEAGESEFVLRIGTDHAKQRATGRPATIEIISDGSQQRAATKVQRLRRLLDAHGQELVRRRLLARGVSPSLVRPLQIHEIETASGQQLASRMLSMIPMFVLMAAFFCGMQVAVDTTAGERERGSLEPLLLTAVPRSILAAGKWLAASVFAIAGVGLTLLLSDWALANVGLADLGFRVHVDATALWTIAALALPLALFASGLQLLVGTFARSFKEAQVYVTLVTFVPVVPGVMTLIAPIQDPSWHLLVPALAQQILVADALAGEPAAWWAVLVVGIAAVALGSAAAWLTGRLFGNERIVYGR